MLRGKRGLVLIQIVLITIFAFAYVQAKNDNIIQNLNLFGQVLKNVEEKYVEEVDVANYWKRLPKVFFAHLIHIVSF